jgi:hypothetical protein
MTASDPIRAAQEVKRTAVLLRDARARLTTRLTPTSRPVAIALRAPAGQRSRASVRPCGYEPNLILR